MDIQDLNNRFGIAESLSFFSYGDGMAMAEVNTPQCTAKIALQGAQVFDWTPDGQLPVIWLSKQAIFAKNKSLRGGVPICWPWFGAHDSNNAFPAHGFARVLPWQVGSSRMLADGRIQLVLELDAGVIDHNLWPFSTRLELTVIFGLELELELCTYNTDTQAIIVTEALHTYFSVGDVRQVGVLGLDGSDYLDKVQGFARFTQQGPIKFCSEVDRIYFDTQAECVVDDPTLQRRIHISKTESQSTVVWNPWTEKSVAMGDMGEDGYLTMLCVESGNAANNKVRIEPGKQHCLRVRYRVEKTVRDTNE